MMNKIFHSLYQTYPYFLMTLVGCLLLGACWDSWPLLNQFYRLLEEKNQLTLQLDEKEKAWRQAAPVAGQWLNRGLNTELNSRGSLAKQSQPLLEQLNIAAKNQACRLNLLQAEFKIKEMKNTNTESAPSVAPISYASLLIKMDIETNFSGLYRFLTVLYQQGLPLHLDSILLKRKTDRLDVVMQLTAFPWILRSVAPLNANKLMSPCCERDPFQEALVFPQEDLSGESSILNQLQERSIS